jgi:hypothetical protein
MKHELIKWGGRGGGEEVRVLREHIPNEEGDLAIRFAERFAVIAAVEDGVDEAGRAKLRLQTVPEVVERACELAAQMTTALRERNWILDLPIPKSPDPEIWSRSEASPRRVREAPPDVDTPPTEESPPTPPTENK